MTDYKKAREAMCVLQNLAINVACEELHHKKKHQHPLGAPCPVAEEIQQAAGIVFVRLKGLEEENKELKEEIATLKRMAWE